MKVLKMLVWVLVATMVLAGCSKKTPPQGPNLIEDAVKAGDRDKLAGMIDDLKDAEQKKAVAQEALKFAAIHNKADLLPYLFEQGADVKKANADGLTPLHFAAQYGSVDVARVLVQKGAAVNAKMLMGDTPLDNAAGAGKTEMVEFLKSSGGRSGR